MNYEVKEKKFYELKDLKNILNYEYNLKHLETTFDLEKYLLVLMISYEKNNGDILEKEIQFPIEFNTSMTEQLTTTVKNIDIKHIENSGIEIVFEFDVNIENITSNDIEPDKKEIKEIYQQELEEILTERVEVVEEKENIKLLENDEDDSFLNLKTDFVKFKVINLEEQSIDKISAKYNISIEHLFELKKSNNKLIVYDKE